MSTETTGEDIVARLRREGRVYTHIEAALHIEVMRNLLREALDTRAPDYVHVRYPGWADRVRKEIASHVR